MSYDIEEYEDQEDQEVSSCSEVLHIQAQANLPLWAAFLLHGLLCLQIYTTVNAKPSSKASDGLQMSSGEDVSTCCPLVTGWMHNMPLSCNYTSIKYTWNLIIALGLH